MTTKPVSHDVEREKFEAFEGSLSNSLHLFTLHDVDEKTISHAKTIILEAYQAATAQQAKELNAALADLETYRKIVDHEVNENAKHQETIARMQCAINELKEALNEIKDMNPHSSEDTANLMQETAKEAIAKVKAMQSKA